MRIVISFFLTFFIVTSLESQDLETFFDSLDKKLSIGLIGVESGQYGRYKVSQTKRQLVEINRLKIERAITESLKSKNVTLKNIVYNNTICFPSDYLENRDARDDFYRKINKRLLEKLAKVNRVDMIVFVRIYKMKFKKYIKRDGTNYFVRVSVFMASSNSIKSNYIRVYENMYQSEIFHLVYKILNNNIQSLSPHTLMKRESEIEINDASAW